jgi:NADPH:quinone reductase-like Zn-dependent oxidoreductase
VEAVGRNVTRFAPGDAVFGETVTGMQWMNGGAFAEYVAVAADALEGKPANVGFEQAASVPTAGLIALNNLRNRTAIRPGMRVLVNGAGGGVGSLALQIAKAGGAHVTGVDHGRKLDLLRTLGADAVIDYTRDDPTLGDARYDLVFDVASNLRLADCKRILAPGGLYVAIGHDHFGAATGSLLGSLPRMMGLMFRSLFDRHVPKGEFKVAPKRETMPVLAGLLASGKITPVIDKVFPLEEAVAAACGPSSPILPRPSGWWRGAGESLKSRWPTASPIAQSPRAFCECWMIPTACLPPN